MGHVGGNRERGRWAELSYILEVKMTGLDNGLHMESRRNGGDKNNFRVSNLNN